ncbi:hypothetical protein [Microcoleus phage My-WqHQDG]|nr:hypothetical protein [Microcoleus phage My-WqHQDG]
MTEMMIDNTASEMLGDLRSTAPGFTPLSICNGGTGMIRRPKRTIRQVTRAFTQEEADTFTPSITPESLPYILSSVVPLDGTGTFPRTIKKYYISGIDGALQIYQGAYLYPSDTSTASVMYAHVEVVFDEVPVPHESVLKWCSLALKAGPISASARANQLVIVQGNHLHYMWRVLSVEAEAALPSTRSLDITNLHLWRWHPVVEDMAGKWVCGRVSLDIQLSTLLDQSSYTLTTSRGARTIDWAGLTSFVCDDEPIHKLYFTLLGEGLL